MTPTDAQIQQMYQDDQYRQQQYQQLLQQQADRDRQLRAMKAETATSRPPVSIGKFGGTTRRRSQQPAQQMTQDQFAAIMAAQAQQEAQAQGMEEQPAPKRWTSDQLNMPSFYLQEQVNAERNRQNGVNSGSNSGHSILSAYGTLFGGKTSVNGTKSKSACEELWGSRFSTNGGGQG